MTVPEAWASVKREADRKWEELQRPRRPVFDPSRPPVMPDVLWTPQLTPVLPVDWPPYGGNPVCTYGYGFGQAFAIRDGIYVMKPWIRIDFDLRTGSMWPHVLGPVDEKDGTLGIRPLSAGEIKEQEALGDVQTDFALHLRDHDGAPSGKLASRVKRFYRMKMREQGSLKFISERHAAFVSWVNRDPLWNFWSA